METNRVVPAEFAESDRREGLDQDELEVEERLGEKMEEQDQVVSINENGDRLDAVGRVISSNSSKPLPPSPTSALPGSIEKLEVLIERASKGYLLYHPLDATLDGDMVERSDIQLFVGYKGARPGVGGKKGVSIQPRKREGEGKSGRERRVLGE